MPSAFCSTELASTRISWPKWSEPQFRRIRALIEPPSDGLRGERAAAASRVLRDRDYDALRATMERLDREEAAAARAPKVRAGVPTADAVRFLSGLGDAWRLAAGGAGRAMLARSLFERLEASGFRELTVALTPEAISHGFAVAVPAQFTATAGNGRGERIWTASPTTRIVVPEWMAKALGGTDSYDWIRYGRG